MSDPPVVFAALTPTEPVLVTWIDSGLHISDEWKNAEAAVDDVIRPDRNKTVRTIGYMLGGDDEWLVIAQSWDPEHEHYIGFQAIYRPCVIEIRNLN